MKAVSIQINFKFATSLNVQALNNTLDYLTVLFIM